MRRLVPIVVFLFCAACSNEDTGQQGEPDSGPSCTFTLTWGHRAPGEAFTAFNDGDDAEITLGFQGFRYIQSTLKLENVKAPSAYHSARITVEGQQPYSLSDTPVKVHDEGGALFSDDVLVFFNDLPIADIIGKTAEVTLTAKAGGCLGTTKTTVTLRDDESCVQQEDGGLVCDTPDGGP